MLPTVAIGLAASVGLAFAPLPFVWLPLLWTGLFLWQAARTEGPRARLAWINAAGVLGVFALAEIALQLRPGLELTGLEEDYLQEHETLGYAPLASSRVTATRRFGSERLYEAEYTIGPDGLRAAPPVAPGGGRECLLFFGGSFTFGEGVNDRDAMPYRVGERTNGRFRVYNFAFHGYGPHQMLAALEDELVAGTIDCVPRFAIYQALPDHAIRAAGYRSWDVHGPRYVLDASDGVVYAGHFDDGAAFAGRALLAWLERSKLLATLLAWRRPDPDRSERLLVAIVAAARDRIEGRHPGAELHVILWDDEGSALQRRLESAGLRVHSIEAIVPEPERRGPRYTIPRDGHPTAALQDRVAEYVVREIVGDGEGAAGSAGPAR